MKKLLLTLPALLAMSCVHTAKSADPASIRTYEEEASELLDSIEKNESRERIAQQAKALLSRGEGLVHGYMKGHPECADYLEQTLAAAEKFGRMTEEQIEKYHRGDDLPEGRRQCSHAKDLVIHPATVLVLAKHDGAEQTEKMADEIREALAHLRVFEKSLAP